MQWTFLTLDAKWAHAEMPVFQIVDGQRGSILAFSGRRAGKLFTMTLIIEADEATAKRIETLLPGRHAVLRVDVFRTCMFDVKHRQKES